MADDVAVRIDGARELRAALKRAGVELADLKDANARVSAYVASMAAGRAPRRSGRLASSIRGNKAAGRASVAAGSARLPYAGPIHWGWPSRGIAPQPFIAETAKQTEAIWLADYSRAIDAVIKKVESAT